MLNLQIKRLIYISLFIFCVACKPTAQESIIPVITYNGFEASDSVLHESYSIPQGDSTYSYDDTIILKIGFRDGDGNLGNIENDTLHNIVYLDPIGQNVVDTITSNKVYANIFITDSRTGLTWHRAMPDIAAGANNLVTGEIELTMNRYVCTAFAGEEDTIIYTVYIKDRDDQVSNMLELDTIFLQCRD